MDDESGWHAILVDGWGPLVRDAVVARVEVATVGRRGLLVRALADPDAARYAWTEELHRLVLDAIRVETGADLDELGSQAAWACYEDVWDELARRWGRAEPLPALAPGVGAVARALLREVPTLVAEAAGADVGTVPPTPLEADGALRLDVEGLWALLARETPLGEDDRRRVRQLIDLAEG